MAASGDRSGTPLTRIKAALDDLPGWLSAQDDASLGEPLIEIRAVIDRSESVFADGVRRFDKSGEYKADGSLSLTEWLRWRCKLSGGAAAERVEVARQLEKLPRTGAAFATGDVGYQHVVLIARAAQNVGTAPVQKEEHSLLKAALTMDPGRFAAVAKGFEHRVDAAAALGEANRAYERRYLHLSEPQNGMVRLDGILDLEGGATLKTAVSALMPPPTNGDPRTPGQRRVDALVDLARRPLDGSKLGSVGGQRPHLVITATAETLLGLKGAPPAEMRRTDTDGGSTAARVRSQRELAAWPGRARERECQPRPPPDPGSHPQGAGRPRSQLRLQRLSPAGDLVRWPPPRLVDARGQDGAAQPGTRL